MARKPAKSRLKGNKRIIRARCVPNILALLDAGEIYMDVARLIAEREGVNERTAKNWISYARKQRANTALPLITEKMASDAVHPPPTTVVDVDQTNYGEARWEQLEFCRDRIKIYQELADKLIAKDGRPYDAEKLVLSYSQMLGRLVHWYQLPPERMMTQPAIRAAAVKALIQGFQHMDHGELHQILQAGAAEHEHRIAQANRDENPAESAAETEYQESVQDVL